MTSLVKAFYDVINDYNADETTTSEIYVSEVVFNSSAKEEDLKEAARYLIASLEKTNPDSWLDFEIFKNTNSDSDSYRADVLLTCGGPRAAIEIESAYSDMTFHFYTSGAHIVAYISTESYSAGAEFLSVVQSYAEAF